MGTKHTIVHGSQMHCELYCYCGTLCKDAATQSVTLRKKLLAYSTPDKESIMM